MLYIAQKIVLYYSVWWKREYNIKLTQKNQMMNYMPMLPNLYCVSPLQAPSYVAPAPQREMKSYVNAVLLNTISQALRVSLNNY